MSRAFMVQVPMKTQTLAFLSLAAALAACSSYSSPTSPSDEDQVFTVLAQGFAMPGGSAPDASFEGIAVDPSGEFVYVASFFSGTIVRMRASDLSIVGSTEIPQLIEGLLVTPDGSLLAVHKEGGLSVMSTPSLATVALHASGGGYFIGLQRPGRTLTSGNEPLRLLDTASGETLAEYAPEGGPNMWHFAVAPNGSQIAALRSDDVGREIHILTPDLELVEAFDFPVYGDLRSVIYGPGGNKLYMLARDIFRNDHLVVVDLNAQTSNDALLNPSDCTVLCVANPVTISREGRWIVFGAEHTAYFVDTTVDRLVALLGGGAAGSGVAASPTEDAFFFLRHDGRVTKVAYPILPAN